MIHNFSQDRFSPQDKQAISRKLPPELSCPKVCRPTRARLYSGIPPSFPFRNYGVQFTIFLQNCGLLFPLNRLIGNWHPVLFLRRMGKGMGHSCLDAFFVH
jgi:hypothetical protein